MNEKYTLGKFEVHYPKLRLEEEGAKVVVIGGHPKGTKYTGKSSLFSAENV